MPILSRRKTALLLMVLGLVVLGFGLWIIVGMFLPKTPVDQNLPQAGTDLTVTPRKQPQIIAAPVIVQGTSTISAAAKGADVRDAINRANSVVSRMYSGTNQDGFLGFNDALIDGTAKFADYVKAQQSAMQNAYPASGNTFGLTTRIVSNDVIEGTTGSEIIKIKISAQRAEDAGDRTTPTSVTYWEYVVTLARQSDGMYKVDEMTAKPVARGE